MSTAFETLRKSTSVPLISALLNVDKLFVVSVNTCQVAVGASLMKKQEGKVPYPHHMQIRRYLKKKTDAAGLNSRLLR